MDHWEAIHKLTNVVQGKIMYIGANAPGQSNISQNEFAQQASMEAVKQQLETNSYVVESFLTHGRLCSMKLEHGMECFIFISKNPHGFTVTVPDYKTTTLLSDEILAFVNQFRSGSFSIMWLYYFLLDNNMEPDIIADDELFFNYARHEVYVKINGGMYNVKITGDAGFHETNIQVQQAETQLIQYVQQNARRSF